MSQFDYAFSLFGLLLGFSLVEVLGGFAKAWNRGDQVGFLVPMLGIVVMLDLISFWALLWLARGAIPVSTLSLFFGFAITAVYYFAAVSIFPERVANGYYRAHYLGIRRKVALAVLACNLSAYALISLSFGRLPAQDTRMLVALFAAMFLLLAFLPPRPRLQALLLCLLVAAYLAEAIVFYEVQSG